MNPNHLSNSPAPVDSHEQPHLVFEVAGQLYACPISKVQHLIRLADVAIQPSPADVPAWEVGRVALGEGGEGMPVVALRKLWGYPDSSDQTGQTGQDKQAILIVEVAGRSCALQVDGCRSVIPKLPAGQPRFWISATLQGARGRAFKLATPWNKSLLVVLDLDEIFEAAASPALCAAPYS